MLIEFAVSNFKSIKEESRLSLVAGPDKEHESTHVSAFTPGGGARPTPLLRSAVIYGANAAGKTNLLLGLKTMHDIVLRSSGNLDELPVIPFLFDSKCGQQPTSFEVTCVTGGVRYQYGFSATKTEVVEEWLYAWPSGRMQVWFERNSTTTEDRRWKFGAKLTGDKEVWRRATRSQALFLATAVSLNSKQLTPVFDWFHKRLHVAGIVGWAPSFSVEYSQTTDKNAIIYFLNSADLTVSDMRVVEDEFTLEMLPHDMPTELKKTLTKDLAGTKRVDVFLSHQPAKGTSAELDIDDESHGTQKMFALAGPWLDSLQQGNVIVFDELHDNLHPELLRFLVTRFHDPVVNCHGAQLIFSTHDTSILSGDVFRRDQVWLCERDESLGTSVYPLSDFKKRRNDEDMERAYLSGRFGALPFVSG